MYHANFYRLCKILKIFNFCLFWHAKFLVPEKKAALKNKCVHVYVEVGRSKNHSVSYLKWTCCGLTDNLTISRRQNRFLFWHWKKIACLELCLVWFISTRRGSSFDNVFWTNRHSKITMFFSLKSKAEGDPVCLHRHITVRWKDFE